MTALVQKCRDYLALTKPRIVLLFTLTGFAAFAVEGNSWARPGWLVLILCAIGCTAGSANGLNQYVERRLDALMVRTRTKRPLPAGRIAPMGALIFSWALGLLACGILLWQANILSAAFAAATILFYVLFYTMWLKPRTPYNIVIGGAAGATAPLIAWAAATGTIGWVPLILFLIIFLWTPPHFWALALCYQDDYRTAGFPMLPIVHGEERTRKEIVAYALITAPLPLLLAGWPTVGMIYLVGAVFLGIEFIRRAVLVRMRPGRATAGRLFAYSIAYLFLLNILLTVDAVL
ncbi:MAG: protoheme IX farnesyltransferase [Deltaproteobacteria bacterium]|nr:protoheme IX farnesyltransferase [Deltaproteobacteria bacterium]